MATYTITHQIIDVSGNQTAGKLTETVNGTTALQEDVSVPATTTNQQLTFPALTQANLQAVGLYVSTGGTVTVKTNSTGSPQDTIVLTNGQVLLWTLQTNLIGKCPFSNNVTTIYVTNGGASAVTFSIRVLTN
jgi:hypothetical protein